MADAQLPSEPTLTQYTVELRRFNDLIEDIRTHQLEHDELDNDRFGTLQTGMTELIANLAGWRKTLAPLADNGTPKALAELAHAYKAELQARRALTIATDHYLGFLKVFKKPGTWAVMTLAAAIIWVGTSHYAGVLFPSPSPTPSVHVVQHP